MGIGGLRVHTRVMPTCGIPPLDFGPSFPRAGAVFWRPAGQSGLPARAPDDKLRRPSKAHFNGYRLLDNPHQNCVDISFSRDLMERPQFFPARAEAVSLPSGTTPIKEH